MSDPAVEERLRSLLTAAAAPTEPGELPGERQALADFRAAVDDHSRRSPMRPRITPLKAAAVACAGVGALALGGTAAAASGVLPDAAQDTARNMLEKVGVAVPGAEEEPTEPADEATSQGQGEEISELAKVSEPGPEHGATVSGAASDKEQTDSGTTPETEDQTSAGKGEAVSEGAHTADAEGGKGEEVAPLASEGKAGGAAAGAEDTETDTGDGETDAAPERGTAHSSGADDRGEQTADGAGSGRSTAGTAHRP